MKRAAIGVFLAPIALIARQAGAAWTNIGPSPDAVEAIAVDPHGGRTILLGAASNGMRKSVDGGITETVTPNCAGGAPVNAAGPMQVNVQIPGGTQTGGAVPPLLKVGNASSQAGVTIAVR